MRVFGVAAVVGAGSDYQMSLRVNPAWLYFICFRGGSFQLNQNKQTRYVDER
jgi:hypothetical protein